MGRRALAAIVVAAIFCAAGGCTSASGTGDSGVDSATALTALAPVSAASADAMATADDGQMPLPSPAPDQAGTAPSDGTAVSAAPAVAATVGTPVAFAAVIGAPASAMEPLSRELAARASQRGIAVTKADSIGDGHILRGYFSTVDEGTSGSVVYVWDVIDAAGKRVYRIQGEQKLKRGADWSAVPDATMRAIADDTVDQLAVWLAASKA